MRNFSKILFLVIVGVLVYSFIIDDNNIVSNPPVVPSNNQSNSITGLNISDTYAMRAVDNKWPVIDETQMAVVDNLDAKNYYLVFDGSGSMNDSKCSNGKAKINVAKESVIKFISKIPGDANIGLLVFDDRGLYERAVLGGSSREKAISEISNVIAGGGTPLRTSIKTAYQSLTNQAVKQLGYGEYHLIVVTDGASSEGEDPRNVVRDLIINSPLVLHTIGFCIGDGHSLNQAGLTLYKAANNPQELAMGLDSVLAEATDFNVDSFEGQVQ